MTKLAEESHSDPSRPNARRAWWSLALTLGLVGAGLFLFDFFSAGSSVARRGIHAHRPPIYGRFEPSFSHWGVIALALAVLIGIATFFITRRERIKPAILLPVAIALLLSFASAVAFVNGEKNALVHILEPKNIADYQADVKRVRTLGVRPFVERFPEIAPTLVSVHSRDHPPGPIVLLSFLQSLFPRRLVPRALVLAGLSSLLLVAVWMIARRVGGERAGVLAVLLAAVAPGIVIFTFTAVDAVFGAMLAGSGALLVWGIALERRLRFAFLGGLALAITAFMSYAFLWVLAFAGLYALFTRGIRGSIAPLAAMGGGFLVGLAVLRVGLGYDLVATYRAGYELVPRLSKRSALYWVFGDPAVWLTFAGLPIAALSLRELITKQPRYLIALFIPLIISDLLSIFRGETERVGIFAYPFIAAAAGVALARWEDDSGRRRPAVVAALVVFAALQTITIEALYFTFW